MSLFEVFVIVCLVFLAGLAITAVLLLLRGSKTQLEPKLDAIDLRLGDSIGIVNLAVSGLRDELVKSSASLREELATRVESLGAGLQTTVGAIGTQQGERLDFVSAEQNRRFNGFGTSLTEHRTASAGDSKSLRDEVQSSLLSLGRKVAENVEVSGVKQSEAIANATAAIRDMGSANEKKQDALKSAVEGRLETLRDENSRKLEEMRITVDEKLQGTLEKRLGASFTTVNENLERVFKSVGEMQALATGVGDLKRVLSNVKTRGTWGEGSLGVLLEEVMTPEQYSLNVEVRPSSGQRVEFAIKLPGDSDTPLWLPLDSKMPLGDYERLMAAADLGDALAVDASGKGLERTILSFAKDISSKYVCPPHTTDFGVMFLPSEGLFAEVVRRPGLVDKLQRECRVIITGPTTLMALLNSLRMGFRTLAIQQRSSEVWQVLASVKTEFGKFGPVLEKVHKKLGEAQSAIDQTRVRGRAIERNLRDIEALPDTIGQNLLVSAITDVTDEILNDDDDE